MVQQIGRVLVHADSARSLELILTVTAGQQSYAETSRAPRRKHIPDAVADDYRGLDADLKTRGSSGKEIGVWLRASDVVAADHDDVGRLHAQEFDTVLRRRQAPARGDRPWNPHPSQMREEGSCPGKRPDPLHQAEVGLGMAAVKFLEQRWSDLAFDLAQQHLREQSTAHADAAVNAPHGKFDARFMQRPMPRRDVLINAVDQRAVEIEEETDFVVTHPIAPCLSRSGW